MVYSDSDAKRARPPHPSGRLPPGARRDDADAPPDPSAPAAFREPVVDRSPREPTVGRSAAAERPSLRQRVGSGFCRPGGLARAAALVALLALSASACDALTGGGEAEPDAVMGTECAVAEDCPEGYGCAAGRCQPAGETGLGGACWANRDCESGLYCAAQARCAPAGPGEDGAVCGTGGECADHLRCELAGLSGQCRPAGDVDVGGACGEDADCLAGLVCGAAETCAHPTEAYPEWEGVACEDDGGPFRVLFELPPGEAGGFFRLPFPTDARVQSGGELATDDFPRPGPQALGIDFVDLYAETLSEDFRGFSPTAAVTMRVSGGVDEAATPDGAIRFVDVTEGAESFGEPVPHDWRYDPDGNRYRCPHALLAAPAPGALRLGHTYAVYATAELTSESGEAAQADGDFATVAAGDRPAGGDLEAAWEAHAPLRNYLADEDTTDPGEVAGAALFTVQDGDAPARALADAVADGEPPALADLAVCDGGGESPCAGEDRGCVNEGGSYTEIHGRMTIPRFQEGDPPFENRDDGGAIPFAEDGAPIVQGEDEVCVALTIPDGEAPADGWPLVVYGHGTGGDFTSGIRQGVAEALATAEAPMAMLSYDGVAHGERKRDSNRDPETLMFNIGNPRAARDNHLQGAVDILQALRAAETSHEVGGVGEIAFDAESAFVFGHSQGGNVGVPAVAVTDRTEAAVISGTGAHLSEALLAKTSPVDARAGLERLVGDELSATHPVMILWQTFFDPVDTATFGPHLVDRPPEGTSSAHVLMTYGPGDTFSPPASLAAMARAADLPVVEPPIEELGTGAVARPVSQNRAGGDGAARTAACFQYEADEYDGHFVATRDPGAVADWVEFLVTAQSGAPSVGE